jgi:cell division protein FtsL
MVIALAIMVVAIIGVFAYIWFTERDLLHQMEDAIKKQEEINKKLNEELDRMQFEQEVDLK